MAEAKKPPTLGKCVIKEEIGRGSMGVVYLGHHQALNIPVALKVPPPELAARNPLFAERLIQEAQLAARLNHPNIVRVYDCGYEGGLHYVVMEWVEGQDCAERIAQKGFIPWPEALRIVRKVAEALGHAAEQGIIHRDIKPHNIILTKSGVPKLSDLGLAKQVSGEEDTRFGRRVVGTPKFMSPEHIEQPEKADFRSDIYSLGATFYHMVCGAFPFEAETTSAVMEMHVREPLVSPRVHMTGLPNSLCDVVSKMMAKAPEDRYQSYEKLIEDLERLAAGQEVSAAGAELRLQAQFVPDAESARMVQSAEPFSFSQVPLSFNAFWAKANALLSLLAVACVVLIGFCLLLRTAWGFAAGWGFLAAVAVLWVVATRVSLRSGQAITGEEAESKRKQRIYQILEGLCNRTQLKVPGLRLNEWRDASSFAVGLTSSSASIHISRRILEEVLLTDRETEAMLAGEIGRLYNGDAALMTVLWVPLRVAQKCRLPLRAFYEVVSAVVRSRRVAALPTLLLGGVAAAAVLVLLFHVKFLLGLAGCAALVAALSLNVFQRYSRYVADFCAARLTGDDRPVKSFAAATGLASAAERELILHPLSIQEEAEEPHRTDPALQFRRRVVQVTRHFTGVPAPRGVTGTLIELLYDQPLGGKRINELAQVPTAARPVRWVQKALTDPLRIYVNLVYPRAPEVSSSRPLVENLYVPVAAAGVAGIVSAALHLALCYGGYENYWLAPVASILLSGVLGVLWAWRCSRWALAPAVSAFGFPVLSYSLALCAMATFAFFGGPRYAGLAFSFPALFFFSLVFTSLAGAATSRMLRPVRLAEERGQRTG